MDWVFKASSSSWDLMTELDRDDEFDLFNDSSIIMGKNQNMEVLSVDDGTMMNKWKDQKQHSTTISSSSSSSKKPREQHVSCLVDGCPADLSSCREYHRRHRVCEAHSKAPVVTIGAKDQRFCQQCSRFHSLGEFDDEKRSCRKRLDGHNKRRRKPRAESMYLNYGSFLTNHQGTKLLRFGDSPAYTTWPIKEKLNQEPSNSNARLERKFPFLLNTDDFDKVSQPISEASFQHTNASSALSLLSKHTSESVQTPTNLVQQFNRHHSNPHMPLTNVTGPDNHLIEMIHFRTQGLLENEVLSFSWEE